MDQFLFCKDLFLTLEEIVFEQIDKIDKLTFFLWFFFSEKKFQKFSFFSFSSIYLPLFCRLQGSFTHTFQIAQRRNLNRKFSIFSNRNSQEAAIVTTVFFLLCKHHVKAHLHVQFHRRYCIKLVHFPEYNFL